MKTQIHIPDKTNITAVIVAGGQSSRMGGQDKGLIKLHGKTIIEQIIEQISPQLDRVIINANRNREQYRQFGFPVIKDKIPGFQGPLAGILTALDTVNTEFIITLPCDGPQLAADYVARLSTTLAENSAEIAVAHDGFRMQQMYALIPASLAVDLTAFLKQGNRAIKLWLAQHKVAIADFSDYPEMFLNINTDEELRNL
ncbi:molybdenum cofactor guanylyltransferase [bacterium BMS3Bbin11]|nr:molybdenum cofactor guanylyltransferase [bacterium BMS3Abin11]GBE46297.1 molybdenum cofactor guanylyltransferase [bacterium BMS3Bbin11]HDH08898.1 molybdenum cofactor guanylyltransferase [Gammaproteobacteria bacterium]HDH14883.1 molybdenum cofactor guanylyltransferase [Gammaproteobacteria bacterium]